MAGIKYVLSRKADDGHVFLYREELLTACDEILELPRPMVIEEGIAELSAKEEIISEATPEGEAIYLAPFLLCGNRCHQCSVKSLASFRHSCPTRLC